MASISLTARFVRENRAFEKSYQIKGHTTTAAGVQQFLSAQKDIPVLLWEICDARMGIVAAGDEVSHVYSCRPELRIVNLFDDIVPIQQKGRELQYTLQLFIKAHISQHLRVYPRLVRKPHCIRR